MTGSDVDLVILVVAGTTGAFLLLFILIATRYKRVAPNQALVISGGRHLVVDPATGDRQVIGSRIVKGGGAFVYPFIERADVVFLDVVTVPVRAVVHDRQGTPVAVDSVVQVKIRGDDDSIRLAAEHFLSNGLPGVERVVTEMLISHWRAAVGAATIGEMTEDRGAVSGQVKVALTEELASMGLAVVSFHLNEIGAA